MGLAPGGGWYQWEPLLRVSWGGEIVEVAPDSSLGLNTGNGIESCLPHFYHPGYHVVSRDRDVGGW